jgi:hypothetical protein
MLDFFRRHYKVVIWLMILSFFLTLVPSVFF